MDKLSKKEQTLLAYYICNFLKEKGETQNELGEALKKGLGEELASVQEALQKEGLLGNSNHMITNEGILYIDNILHIQSYATEGNKLAYVKDSLLINEMEIFVDELKEYIHKHVKIDESNPHY